MHLQEEVVGALIQPLKAHMKQGMVGQHMSSTCSVLVLYIIRKYCTYLQYSIVCAFHIGNFIADTFCVQYVLYTHTYVHTCAFVLAQTSPFSQVQWIVVHPPPLYLPNPITCHQFCVWID